MLDDDQSFPDGISSPIAAHILDFCDDGTGGGDLFAAVHAASDVFAASSEDASSSSTTATPPLCGDNMSSSGAAAVTAFSPLPSLDSTLSALLEEDDQPPGPVDAELLLPIDYAFSADETQPDQQQFGQMVLPVASAAEHHPALQTQMSSTASELMQLASGYTDECFSAALAGGFMGLDETTMCQQQPGAMLPAAQGCYAAAQGGFFDGSGCAGTVMSMMLGMEEMGEYQRMAMMEGAGALVDADSSAQMAFSAASEMQMGSGSPGQFPATGAAGESSSLEETNFKAARLSVEERKEKIHRYIKKRNERNFSKKIKYACRKTLADSRPRVRGRFAKNDEYCESSRAIGSQSHEEYDQMSGVKGEDMLDPEALAHITGMSSYMYNHTVESWI